MCVFSSMQNLPGLNLPTGTCSTRWFEAKRRNNRSIGVSDTCPEMKYVAEYHSRNSAGSAWPLTRPATWEAVMGSFPCLFHNSNTRRSFITLNVAVTAG